MAASNAGVLATGNGRTSRCTGCLCPPKAWTVSRPLAPCCTGTCCAGELRASSTRSRSAPASRTAAASTKSVICAGASPLTWSPRSGSGTCPSGPDVAGRSGRTTCHQAGRHGALHPRRPLRPQRSQRSTGDDRRGPSSCRRAGWLASITRSASRCPERRTGGVKFQSHAVIAIRATQEWGGIKPD